MPWQAPQKSDARSQTLLAACTGRLLGKATARNAGKRDLEGKAKLLFFISEIKKTSSNVSLVGSTDVFGGAALLSPSGVCEHRGGREEAWAPAAGLL